jgi:HlyD family secretion protein
MTASAEIQAAQRRNVLMVRNAALRFAPAAAASSGSQGAGSGSIVARLVPRMPAPQRRAGARTAASRSVWVLRDGQAVEVPVTPGLSDGRMTEIVGGGLQPGMAVIVEQVQGAAP